MVKFIDVKMLKTNITIFVTHLSSFRIEETRLSSPLLNNFFYLRVIEAERSSPLRVSMYQIILFARKRLSVLASIFFNRFSLNFAMSTISSYT